MIFLSSIKRLNFIRKERNRIKRENKHRCFIIGSGPSINSMDLSVLNNEDVMIVNRGYNLVKRGLLRATYYGISDVNASKEYGHEIDPSFSEHYLSFGISNINLLPKGFDSIHFKYHDNSYVDKKLKNGFLPKNCLYRFGGCYSIVLLMTQLAYILGYKEIYVIGVDNNFSKLKNIHWYVDSNNEKNNMKKWGFNPEEDNELSFERIFTEALKKGVLIMNAGVGGDLRSLPRINLSKLCG